MDRPGAGTGPTRGLRGRPRQGAAPGLWGASEAALWTLSSSSHKNNSRKFSSSSEKISRSNFSEIQKQETDTRHLVNRLVRQNA